MVLLCFNFQRLTISWIPLVAVKLSFVMWLSDGATSDVPD